MSLWSRVQRRLGDLAGELVLDEYRDQLNHAQQLLGAGDVAAAIEVLEALLTAKSEHGQALIVLGEAQLMNRAPQKAVEAFEPKLPQIWAREAAIRGICMNLMINYCNCFFYVNY